MPFAPLNTTWFALIGLLWAGYLFLDGFDFGVAIVTPFVAADETDRRICLNSVGPFWDGNEVWLLVAGGATFAAFPLWYARLFSGFYLALFLVLLALIARGVSFEFRDKIESARWRKIWDVANFGGSLVPALVLGVAFTDLVHGVRLGPGGHYYDGLPGLLHPIAILGGLAGVAIFVFQGSTFLTLKTGGALAERAKRAATVSGPAAVILLAAAIAWVGLAGRPVTTAQLPGTIPLVFALVGVGLLGAATAFVRRDRCGLAFAFGGAAVLAVVGAVFSSMFPAVIPATNGPLAAVTIGSASSQHYTLEVMTIVAAIFTPFVLAYQTWTYWVFRQRLLRPPAADADVPGADAGAGT